METFNFHNTKSDSDTPKKEIGNKYFQFSMKYSQPSNFILSFVNLLLILQEFAEAKMPNFWPGGRGKFGFVLTI